MRRVRSEGDVLLRACEVLALQTMRGHRGQCALHVYKFHAASSLVNTQDCSTVGSNPGTVAVVSFAHGHLNDGNEGHSQGMSQSPIKISECPAPLAK